jgi:hypothetical protein
MTLIMMDLIKERIHFQTRTINKLEILPTSIKVAIGVEVGLDGSTIREELGCKGEIRK